MQQRVGPLRANTSKSHCSRPTPTFPKSLYHHAAANVVASAQHQQPHKKDVSEHKPKQQIVAVDDPRLKWARPEWIQQPQQQQQQQATNSSRQRPVNPAGISNSSNNTPGHAHQLQKRQRLLNKVTYGSHSSSSDSDDDVGASYSSSSSSSGILRESQQPLLFQALGVDFGAHRIGIAVRRCSHNVPLMTLHRQQHYQPRQQQQQQNQQQQRSSSNLVPIKRTAAAVLQLALREGCDGFVIGLPVYSQQQPASSQSAAAAAEAAASNARWINGVIQGFASALADLASPLQLPVYLVNEQQSSQQARSVMSGAAAYDIKTLAELQAVAAAVTADSPQQQQQKQQQAVGRDAYAAALILSRYYNGLVTPMEQLSSDSSSSDSSSSNDSSSSWAWSSKKVQQQAATDLKYMQVHPGEQRRRQQQRQRMKDTALLAAAAAATDSADDSSSSCPSSS